MYHLRPSLAAHAQKAHISVRQLAKELGVSFSALAKILRGETNQPAPHTDLAIQRFLGLDAPPCPCAKCRASGAGGLSLGKLERQLARLQLRLDEVEETQERLEALLAQTPVRKRAAVARG